MANSKNCCEVKYEDGILAVKIMGEVDHHTAPEIRGEIDQQIFFYRAKKVVLDLSEIGFMDSSGLGLILGRYAKVSELGGTLIIVDPTEEIGKILELAGTEKIIPIKYSEKISKGGKKV